MIQSRRTNLNYHVVREVVGDGQTVRSGDYKGHRIELGVGYQGTIVWQEPQYLLVLLVEDVGFLSMEVDVTEHVNAGAILIR